MFVHVLDREMYSEAEAARLLRVAQGTLHYWLEGGERRGKQYDPVIREKPTGSRHLTWAEFIEAGLLREYRRAHGVPMAELRAFIDVLRHELGVPYPLAHRQPFVGEGRQLIINAQEKAKLSTDFFLVTWARQQLVLLPASERFVQRVTWADDVATAWRPHDDADSPVTIDPVRRFGRPSVAGVSTEVIWEHNDAGESVEEIADAFDLTPRDVRWGLSFENSRWAEDSRRAA